ncbi:serine/threonine-protein kinase [Spirillospora sp. CA-294931]|uniref:serine/threonine-protein kinase n=1 Tax=Spirillospora sp. CA-294931 TaxID=3240042 RepID=UPI003D90FDD7
MPTTGTDDAFISGRVIDGYRLDRVLGKGGMGTVYLATDRGGRRVAIKVINRDLTGRPEFRERFRREVTAAGRVRPFCTAPVLDAKLEGDTLYVVTEYVEGPTLEHVVTKYGPLYGSDLEGLAAGVATALAAIHSAEVVHRDLKPENILLSPFGPRVIDFGIARRLGTDAPLTKTGDTMGTPSYMAPEGLTGQPVTAVADVFSWGCVIAFAGTGRLPFAGENVGEMLYKTVYGEPRLDGLEPPLRRLVEWATAKDPAARPTSARLLQELTGQTDTARAAQSVGAVGPAPVTHPASPATPVDGASLAPRDGRTRRMLERRGLRLPWVAAAIALVIAVATVAVIALGPGEGGGAGTEKIFADDFADPKSGWATGRGGSEFEEYRDGAFVIAQYGHGFHQVQHAPARNLPEHVRVEATVTVRSSDPQDEAGVFCRGDGQLRYDVSLMRNGKVRIRKGDERSGVELARSGAAVVTSPQSGGRLRADCASAGDGVRIEASVGGRKVAEAIDRKDALTGTRAGLVVGREGRAGYPPATEARFDDFSLHRVS